MTQRVPELLSPAGSLEKLKVAIMYGANGVYLAGQKFGLRTASENFNDRELQVALKFAHDKNAKVYVALNGFLHDDDLEGLPEFIKFLEKIEVDGVIVSDLGVLNLVKKESDLKIHLSTQASCLNLEAAKLWERLGVKRVVLGREVSISEAAKIKQGTNLEIEMFIHGSMCISYSGNCIISNYTKGRDSNRGGCAHSCRFKYELISGDQNRECYFMSSKDLNGLELLPEFIEAGIDSLKIEGRMKSHHYVGTVTAVYANALKKFKSMDVSQFQEELLKIPNRHYFTGNLKNLADENSLSLKIKRADKTHEMVGKVVESRAQEYTLVEIRNPFNLGDTLELIKFDGTNYEFRVDKMSNLCDEEYERSRPGTIVKLPYIKDALKFNIVRKKL